MVSKLPIIWKQTVEQADDSLSDDDVEGLALDQVIEHAIAIGQPIADW